MAYWERNRSLNWGESSVYSFRKDILLIPHETLQSFPKTAYHTSLWLRQSTTRILFK